MRNMHPRQNEIGRVISNEANITAARFRAPADVAIAAAEVTRRRTLLQAGDGPTLRPNQKFEVLTDWLFAIQIVTLLHQAVEQRFLIRTPHLFNLHWSEFLQRALNGSGVNRV